MGRPALTRGRGGGALQLRSAVGPVLVQAGVTSLRSSSSLFHWVRRDTNLTFNIDKESSCHKKELCYHGSSLHLLSGFSKSCVEWELASEEVAGSFLVFFAARSHVCSRFPI